MIIESKAPLRIGLAGGGTDVPPYSRGKGGCVVNMTINRYAYCRIEPLPGTAIEVIEKDTGKRITVDIPEQSSAPIPLPYHDSIPLAALNHFIKHFGLKPVPLKMQIWSDVTYSSGLGASSAMTVAVIKALSILAGIELDEAQTAQLAIKIEREDCNTIGGVQDQYAASFGGLNIINISPEGEIEIEHCQLPPAITNNICERMMLFYTHPRHNLRHHALEQSPETTLAILEFAQKLAHLIKKIQHLQSGTLQASQISDQITNIIAQSWSLKPTDGLIDTCCIDFHALGLNDANIDASKICGAGGGGYAAIICNNPDVEDLKNKMLPHTSSIIMPRFEPKGARACLYNQ